MFFNRWAGLSREARVVERCVVAALVRVMFVHILLDGFAVVLGVVVDDPTAIPTAVR